MRIKPRAWKHMTIKQRLVVLYFVANKNCLIAATIKQRGFKPRKFK